MAGIGDVFGIMGGGDGESNMSSDYKKHMKRQRVAATEEYNYAKNATSPYTQAGSEYYQPAIQSAMEAAKLNPMQGMYATARRDLAKRLARSGLGETGMANAAYQELARDYENAAAQAGMQQAGLYGTLASNLASSALGGLGSRQRALDAYRQAEIAGTVKAQKTGGTDWGQVAGDVASAAIPFLLL